MTVGQIPSEISDVESFQNPRQTGEASRVRQSRAPIAPIHKSAALGSTDGPGGVGQPDSPDTQRADRKVRTRAADVRDGQKQRVVARNRGSHRTFVEPVRRGPWPGGKGIKPGVGSRSAKCVH